MIAMIGTSDRLCWLAETCKILLLLLLLPRQLGMQGNATMYSNANVWMQTFDCCCIYLWQTSEEILGTIWKLRCLAQISQAAQQELGMAYLLTAGACCCLLSIIVLLLTTIRLLSSNQ